MNWWIPAKLRSTTQRFFPSPEPLTVDYAAAGDLRCDPSLITLASIFHEPGEPTRDGADAVVEA